MIGRGGRLPRGVPDRGELAPGIPRDASGTPEAQALLEFLVAPAREREGMARVVRQELAAARLNEASLREVLEQRRPGEPTGCAQLGEELAAARDRVLAIARILLGMRAAAAAIAFRT